MYTDTTTTTHDQTDETATASLPAGVIPTALITLPAVIPPAPTSYELNVPGHVLRGLLQVAGKKDVRYFLNGIFCEPSTGTLVASDGHCLMAHRVEGAELVNGIAPFIIPRVLAERALKLIAKSSYQVLSIHIDGAIGSQRPITIRGATGTEIVNEVDGRYPDWRRTVPRASKLNGARAEFDPSLMARVQQALGDAMDNRSRYTFIRIQYTGRESGILVTCSCERTLAVVMPWRSGDWAGDPPALTMLGITEEEAETDAAAA